MSKPNLYKVTNITTGEVWDRLNAHEIGERLNMSHTTVRKYASKYGAIRQYKIEVIFKEKRENPKPGMKALFDEWDKFVPKLNKRIIKTEAI